MILAGITIPLLLIFFVVLGYVIGEKLSPALLNLQNKIRKKAGIKKYRMHHDLGGLILIAISLFSPILWLGVAISGLGLGIFIHHIVTRGIIFVSKG